MADLADGIVRTMTFGFASVKTKVALPPNWKKMTDDEGKSYYLNTVTKKIQEEPPKPLPEGWVEKVNADSGRPYYYNTATRKVTYEMPEEAADPADVSDARGANEDDGGLLAKTLSFVPFAGGKKAPAGGNGGGGGDDEGLLGKTLSFVPGLGGAKKKPAAKPAATADRKKYRRNSALPKPQQVHISCRALIKELKLCVDKSQLAQLDELYEEVSSGRMKGLTAMPLLKDLVGSTLVQQASLVVANTRAGTLPHGWIEYVDDASKREYYYNVHTKVTTWYKPQMPAVKEDGPKREKTRPKEEAGAKAAESAPELDGSASFLEDEDDDEEYAVDVDFTPESHHIALYAEL